MSWDPRSIPSQAGKTFVVTGGNAGIGYFISEQLAAAGGHVIIACRSAAKADAAIAAIHARTPEAQLEHVALGLSSHASVRSAAATLTGRRIDAIIENAGSIMPSKKRETTVDGNEVMFGTNHLGHFLLTALLYPTLAATPGARVVTMGSGATRLTKAHLTDLQSSSSFAPFAAYGQSKHATQSFGFELDRRLRAARGSVTSLVAHPGSGIDGLSPHRAGVTNPSAGGRLFARVFPFVGGGKDRAAWSAVRAATDPDAVGGQYWGPRGGFSGPPVRQKPVASSSSAAFGAALWSASEKLVGQAFGV
ncbi:SDR family NAD(P)-dependent oxidoreductase [Lacisediminihabitans sp. H27-G8]|uniref:SDR family NAD(P)-dependent oxidoreductase n=1 Tax=Lacisediminihabitans sp. H27-G8 TaxID=3111909 RepID=UPI0038FC5F5A